MKMRKLFKKGFTLVELVVVIAVIAVLAAVSVGAYFGVTDSANSSNAVAAQKQVKDMWLLYSVEEYDGLADKSNDNVGTDFCLRYLPEMGYDSVYTNYRVVNIDYNKSSVSPVNGNSSIEQGLLIKIETKYSSWFLIDGNKIIETSEIYKTTKDFENSIINSKYLIDNIKFHDFEIGTVLVNGEEKRGFKYFYFEITPLNNAADSETKNELVKGGKTLDSIKNHDYALKSYSYSNDGVTIKAEHYFEFFESETDEYYDPSNMCEINEKDEVVDSSNLNISLSEFQYVIEIISLKQIYTSSEANIENYPIAISKSSNIDFYDDFSSIDTPLSDEQATMFIGKNVVLDTDFILPSKYTMIIEFNDDQISNISGYETKKENEVERGKNTPTEGADEEKTFGHLDSDLHSTDLDTSGGRTPTYLRENIQPVVDKSKYFGLTINDAKLTVYGKIYVEGYTTIANNSYSAGLLQYGYIENNGIINLESGSLLRSFGRIIGGGIINAKDGSTIIDLFKISSYTGFNNTLQSYLGTKLEISLSSLTVPTALEKAVNEGKTPGVFPFLDYHIDNIVCNIEFFYGSTYKSVNYLAYDTFDLKFPSVINVISKTRDSLICMQPDSLIKKGYNYTSGNTTFDIKSGTVDFGKIEIPFNMSFDGFFNINVTFESTKFYFPICNMDISVHKEAIVNIKDYESSGLKIEIFPTSTLKNEGTINISGKSSLSINNLPEDAYATILNDNLNGMDATVYRFFKANNLLSNNYKNIFVNKGDIHISSNNAGLYAFETDNILADTSEGNIFYLDDSNNSTYSDRSYEMKYPSLNNKLNYTASLFSGIKIQDPTYKYYSIPLYQ